MKPSETVCEVFPDCTSEMTPVGSESIKALIPRATSVSPVLSPRSVVKRLSRRGEIDPHDDLMITRHEKSALSRLYRVTRNTKPSNHAWKEWMSGASIVSPVMSPRSAVKRIKSRRGEINPYDDLMITRHEKSDFPRAHYASRNDTETNHVLGEWIPHVSNVSPVTSPRSVVKRLNARKGEVYAYDDLMITRHEKSAFPRADGVSRKREETNHFLNKRGFSLGSRDTATRTIRFIGESIRHDEFPTVQYSEEEKSLCWYSQRDLSLAGQEARAFVYYMEEEAIGSSGSWKRGLENLTLDSFTTSARNRRMALEAVLSEQNDQRLRGEYDDKAMSEKYQKISLSCRFPAYHRALQDQKDVLPSRILRRSSSLSQVWSVPRGICRIRRRASMGAKSGTIARA